MCIRDSSYSRQIAWCALTYGLKIRDIDQIISQLEACLRTIEHQYRSENKLPACISILTLCIALCQNHLGKESWIKNDTIFSQQDDVNFDNKTLRDVSFLSIHSQSLQDVMLYQIKNREQFGTKQFAIIQPSAHSKKHNQQGRTDDNQPAGAMLKAASKAIQLSYTNKVDFWIWSRYERVVKLAGMLN